jgi:hypothetical protein
VGEFLRDNWGSLASVVRVALTVWTLLSARGAKKAAEEASELARKRSLVEDLEEAAGKMQHVGGWVRDRKWEIVQLRSQEVLAICKAVLSRWSDHLGESGNNVRTACTQLSSIARLAMDASLKGADGK